MHLLTGRRSSKHWLNKIDSIDFYEIHPTGIFVLIWNRNSVRLGIKKLTHASHSPHDDQVAVILRVQDISYY